LRQHSDQGIFELEKKCLVLSKQYEVYIESIDLKKPVVLEHLVLLLMKILGLFHVFFQHIILTRYLVMLCMTISKKFGLILDFFGNSGVFVPHNLAIAAKQCFKSE